MVPDRLNGEPIMMIQCVHWDWVSHVICQDFAFLSADGNLQCLRGLELHSRDLLTYQALGQLQSVSLFPLLHVPKLDSGLDRTCCCEFKLWRVRDAV